VPDVQPAPELPLPPSETRSTEKRHSWLGKRAVINISEPQQVHNLIE